MKTIYAAALSAVSMVLFCAKERVRPPASVAPSAHVTPVAASPEPGQKVDDPSIAADYQKADHLLESWQGDNRQLDEARKLLLATIERNRDFAPAYDGLARLECDASYVRGEQHEDEGLRRARKFVDHAIKLDPSLPEAYLTLSSVAYLQRDYDAASFALDRAEQLRARPGSVKGLRAKLLYREGDAKQALALAKEVAASPDASSRERASVYDLMSKIYERMQAMDAADTTYQQRIKSDPNSAWAHGNYADFLLRRGNVDESIVHAERAVRLMPYPLALTALVRAYLAKANQLWDAQQYEAAAGYIDMASTIAGGNADSFYYLGFFYERASKRAHDATLLVRALGAYRKALELNPNHSGARKAVERLER